MSTVVRSVSHFSLAPFATDSHRPFDYQLLLREKSMPLRYCLSQAEREEVGASSKYCKRRRLEDIWLVRLPCTVLLLLHVGSCFTEKAFVRLGDKSRPLPLCYGDLL